MILGFAGKLFFCAFEIFLKVVFAKYFFGEEVEKKNRN